MPRWYMGQRCQGPTELCLEGSLPCARGDFGPSPKYMAAYMTGGGAAGGLGDPEAVNVVPPQQSAAHRSEVAITAGTR